MRRKFRVDKLKLSLFLNSEAQWEVAADFSEAGFVRPREGVVMVSRVLLLLSGLVLGLALFAEPASAGGRHNRSGSCVGCNLKPSKVVNTWSKVHHTRVVHHTKVIPTTRVVNHNRLVLHKHTLNHRHLTIHKHKIVHKETVLHRHNTFHRRAKVHTHSYAERHVTRHVRVVQHRHVRGDDVWCNCGHKFASGY